eukprot:1151408-Pelagomonas_calceolata.AAC.4
MLKCPQSARGALTAGNGKLYPPPSEEAAAAKGRGQSVHAADAACRCRTQMQQEKVVSNVSAVCANGPGIF